MGLSLRDCGLVVAIQLGTVLRYFFVASPTPQSLRRRAKSVFQILLIRRYEEAPKGMTMAQFDFFATWNDDWQLLAQIVEATKARLIPDKWYEAKVPHEYTEVTDTLSAELMKKPRVFVCPAKAKLFAEVGLVKQQCGERTGWYRIQHNDLGNSLALTLPSQFEREGTVWLASGSLFLAREYLNHGTGDWEKPHPTLAEFYRQIRKVLQKNLGRFKATKSMIWIGAEAKALLEAKEAKIADLGVS